MTTIRSPPVVSCENLLSETVFIGVVCSSGLNIPRSQVCGLFTIFRLSGCAVCDKRFFVNLCQRRSLTLSTNDGQEPSLPVGVLSLFGQLSDRIIIEDGPGLTLILSLQRQQYRQHELRRPMGRYAQCCRNLICYTKLRRY